MTDDYRAQIYRDINPYSNPRPYRYFKVFFTVRNKITDEVVSMPFYISSKNTLKWLTSIMSYRSFLPLPTDNFQFTWKVYEVSDSDDIVFHHISSREEWERVSVKYVLTVVLAHHWKIDYIKKITNLLKKIITFWKNRLFIDVETIKTN